MPVTPSCPEKSLLCDLVQLVKPKFSSPLQSRFIPLATRHSGLHNNLHFSPLQILH